MPRIRLAAFAAAYALALPAIAHATQDASWRIAIIADPSLRRVAEGVRDSARPYIRINPILMQSVPSELALFAILHEQAHIVLGHKPEAHSAVGLHLGDTVVVESAEVLAARQRERHDLELAADCAVAKRIAGRSPDLLEVLNRRFQEMIEADTDDDSPTLRERAKVIKVCGVPVPKARGG